MPMSVLLVSALLSIATAAYLVGEAVSHPAQQRRRSMRRAARYGRVRLASRPGAESFRERVVDPLKARLAAWALRLNPRMTVTSVTEKLLAAGLSRTVTPTGFLALKSALAIGGLGAGILAAVGAAGLLGAGFAAVIVALVGYWLPDFAVSTRARKRREQVRSELPDALDLLAVSVEAGLGFDGAIGKLTDHMRGPLIDEFGLALSEMRVGESRADALRGMSERVPAPELEAFVRAVIQADQLGMSLGRILRVQAADARLRRQAAAEERAMKAPIKMLFPTALFIFPAMFLVILGPALISLSKVF
jgi:tight adherence protein C